MDVDNRLLTRLASLKFHAYNGVLLKTKTPMSVAIQWSLN